MATKRSVAYLPVYGEAIDAERQNPAPLLPAMCRLPARREVSVGRRGQQREHLRRGGHHAEPRPDEGPLAIRVARPLGQR
jgi:hypothetical protein